MSVKPATILPWYSSCSPGVASFWCLGIYLLCFSIVYAQIDLPVEFEISVEQPMIVVGEPLVINMSIKNTGTDTLERFQIGSSDFWLIWYQNDTVEGCELAVYSASQLPPFSRDTFGFSWDISDLEPGEMLSCRITYPQTLLPGRETITLKASTFINDDFVSQQLAEFTYALLPLSGIPILVETALEHPIVMAGEPLAVDFRFTNLGMEPVDSVSILSSEFSLVDNEDHVLKDCASGVIVQLLPAAGDQFSLEWRLPGLSPGETVTCRVVFPQTLHAGDEQIRLSVLLDGEVWENETEFAYRIQPFEEMPFSVAIGPRHSTVLLGEPVDFEMRVTNTSPETLAGLVLVGEPFFMHRISFLASLEGCEPFGDLFVEPYLFGWPIWQRENLNPGARLIWQVPELAPGDSTTCRIISQNMPQTGEENVNFSAWRGQTPWRDVAELSYVVVSELPPPAPVPVNSRVWLFLSALMLLLIGACRIQAS